MLSLIFLQEKPSFQILTLLILSIIWQSLILKLKPFEISAVNNISFFNELSVSIYLYVAFLLTDFLEDQLSAGGNEQQLGILRLTISWILTSVLMVVIFVNIIFSLVRIIRASKKYFIRKIACLRGRYLKYLDQQQQKITTINESNTLKSSDLSRINPSVMNQEILQPPFAVEKITDQQSAVQRSLHLGIEKAKIHDMFEHREEEKIEQIEQKSPTINIEQVLAQMGYHSFEQYPGAYVFPKGEQQIDKAEENKNSLFDFYDIYN